MEELKAITKNQIEFQRMVGFPVETILESDRNELSEKYIFKLIEEAVELRKEFPSVVNPWSKSQKVADLTRVKEELADVILFVVNIINVWRFTPDELIGVIKQVQSNNFKNVKTKKMNMLNSDILKMPGKTSGIGQGNLSPKYVFIGQNPGQDITNGYKFWSDKEDGSSKVLLPILEKLGVLGDCYFTNVVKCTTPENAEPSQEMTDFYMSFLLREIEILEFNNPDLRIISMGKWTDDALYNKLSHFKIPHPASVLHGGLITEEFEKIIEEVIEKQR